MKIKTFACSETGWKVWEKKYCTKSYQRAALCKGFFGGLPCCGPYRVVLSTEYKLKVRKIVIFLFTFRINSAKIRTPHHTPFYWIKSETLCFSPFILLFIKLLFFVILFYLSIYLFIYLFNFFIIISYAFLTALELYIYSHIFEHFSDAKA